MRRKTWEAAFIVCCFSGIVFGAGFQLYTEGSSEALGQAGAISGRDDLISLVWYNPSALAGSDRPSIMLGAAFVQLQTDFTGPAGRASMSDDWRTIPHFYYIQPISSNVTALLSVNAPYGLITEWPNGWAGKFAAMYSELHTVYTTPSVSYRLNEKAALSAGFNIVYSKVRLTADRNLTAIGGPNLGVRTVEGDDVSYGYTFSGHYRLAEDWAVGMRYQSRVKLEPEGRATFEAGASSEVQGFADVPASVNFGVANSSISSLSLGLDLVWTEWSSYEALVYSFGTGYPVSVVTPNPEIASKRWNDVWSIRFGGEYDLTDNWVLRAGYVWDQSPIEDATRAPELPGSDRQMVMTGMGWEKNNIGIDIAYSYLWADDSRTGSEVVNAAGPLTAGSAGRFETTTHLLSLSCSYAF